MTRLQSSEERQVRAAVPAAAGRSRVFPPGQRVSVARRKSVVGGRVRQDETAVPHALCWKWCWNDTEPVARYPLCSRGGHVSESRGNFSVEAKVLFDRADAPRARDRSLAAN